MEYTVKQAKAATSLTGCEVVSRNETVENCERARAIRVDDFVLGSLRFFVWEE
jgi:hypothetical protein